MAKQSPLAALERAVRIADGQTALAKLCGPPVTQRHVWIWLNRGKRAPLEHVPAIEAGTGVPAEQLAPDVKWIRNRHGRAIAYQVDLAA